MRPGTRVVYSRYGIGTVARLLDGGRKCMVRFDSRPAVPYVLPVDALRSEDGEQVIAVTQSTPASQPDVLPEPDTVDRASDRQALEALRLGVVPARAIHSVTVDRHAELARLSEMFDLGHGMVVVSGGYGSGKTHLIELAEADAISRGFVVARATFDPVEVPPSHPLRLYSALTRRLHYPDGTVGGLRSLLERLGDSERHISGDRFHRWLSPALFAVHHAPAEVADQVLSFVQGHSREDYGGLHRSLARLGYRGPSLLGLPDYRTFGQIMGHLLGGIATWARDVGDKGLVLLLDEAEFIDRLAATSRAMAENVLRYLAVGALPADDLAFEPDSVYRGGHATHRQISPRFAPDQQLCVLCAFTPNPEIDRVLQGLFSSAGCRMDLEPLRPALFPILGEKIYGLVKRAHPDLDPESDHRRRLTRALAEAFDSGEIVSTRQAARMVVEFWDLYRVDHARALRALTVR